MQNAGIAPTWSNDMCRTRAQLQHGQMACLAWSCSRCCCFRRITRVTGLLSFPGFFPHPAINWAIFSSPLFIITVIFYGLTGFLALGSFLSAPNVVRPSPCLSVRASNYVPHLPNSFIRSSFFIPHLFRFLFLSSCLALALSYFVSS